MYRQSAWSDAVTDSSAARIWSSGHIHGGAIDAKAVVDQIAAANAASPWPAQSPA